MFTTYKQIFNQRAWSYQKAMDDCPEARQNEFLLAVNYLDLRPGDILCDMPSGGGYLKKYVNSASVNFIFLETSEDFLGQCPVDPTCRAHLCSFNHLPVESSSVDRLLSLAALHHVEDKESFFLECLRVLKPGGKLVVADVKDGTDTAEFLNVFVDQFNSMGHKGDFLRPSTLDTLIQCGFSIDMVETEVFPWNFKSEFEMINFCKDLFWLNKADHHQVREGIEKYLGISNTDNGFSLNWELMYVRANVAKER